MSIAARIALACGLCVPALACAQHGSGTGNGERAATPSSPPPAIRAEQAAAPSGARLHLYSDAAYQVGKDQWMIDVVVRTPTFITAQLTDTTGAPLPDVTVSAATRDGSALITAQATRTDAQGEASFGVRPFEAGEEAVTVRGRGQSATMLLNVIDDAALDWEGLDDADGITAWETLLSSQVRYREDYTLDVRYSEPARALDGAQITLVGFMLPLEPSDRQSHFLLVSTPPSCFFHVPGGPAGAVEVHADTAIAVRWDPIVLAGTFQLIDDPEAGLIYRLEHAQLKKVPSP
ncbi:Ig-like domain-containing protein [Algiphilus sp.]|uniref:Ig-like domain-containing protein n=1 Tax=Algiphilus sp. TaxID=1872431 RepID=UPI003B523947